MKSRVAMKIQSNAGQIKSSYKTYFLVKVGKHTLIYLQGWGIKTEISETYFWIRTFKHKNIKIKIKINVGNVWKIKHVSNFPSFHSNRIVFISKTDFHHPLHHLIFSWGRGGRLSRADMIEWRKPKGIGNKALI